MEKKQVLKVYGEKDIQRAILLCDNLFYNNYLENGVLETREEIQNRMKANLTDIFIQFLGFNHTEELTQKITNTRINFVYQTDGLANSAYDFLLQEKIKRFNEKYQSNLQCLVLYEHVAKKFANPFLSLFNKNGKKLQAMLDVEEAPLDLVACLEELKIASKDIINDEKLANSVVNQIKDLGKKFKKLPYSENQTINKNLKFLDKFVAKFKKQVKKACRRYCLDFYDSLYKNSFGTEFDPLVIMQEYDDEAMFFLTDSGTLGSCSKDSSNVYFGINPGETTVIHEFVHEVSNTGFEKLNMDIPENTYSDEIRKYEMFNEVITDYMTLLIKQERIKEDKPLIAYGRDIDSIYAMLFEIMGKFLHSYLPELKEVMLREDPAQEFARIIGKKNFEKIARLSNEVLAVKHDLEVCKTTTKDGYTLNDLLADSNEFFYGSLDFFAGTMANLEQKASKQLTRTLNSALRKQSLIKRVDMFVRDQSRNLAGQWEQKEKPVYQKLSRLMWNVSEKFDSLTEKHALKKLKTPVQSIQRKETAETKTQE